MAQARMNYNSDNRRTMGKSTGAGTSTTRSRKSSRTYNGMYVYDNTARKLDVVRELETPPKKAQSREVRKNRTKARRMSMGYVAFLALALFVCGIILVNYVQLTAEVTARTREIASLESQLNTLKLENDEELNRINSSIDLEEIREIAIGELGMSYAEEGQIVTYSSIGNDYMRKVGGK